MYTFLFEKRVTILLIASTYFLIKDGSSKWKKNIMPKPRELGELFDGRLALVLISDELSNETGSSCLSSPSSLNDPNNLKVPA